jgi:hypothetical protein
MVVKLEDAPENRGRRVGSFSDLRYIFARINASRRD